MPAWYRPQEGHILGWSFRLIVFGCTPPIKKHMTGPFLPGGIPGPFYAFPFENVVIKQRYINRRVMNGISFESLGIVIYYQDHPKWNNCMKRIFAIVYTKCPHIANIIT